MADDKMSFSAPRWRITRWLVEVGPAVPVDIRGALIHSLYGTLPIFAGGVINTVAVAALIAARHFHGRFIFWLLAEVLLCLVRLGVLVRDRRAAACGRRTATDLYIGLAILWAASVGYGVFITLLSGDWVAAALACLSSAAMVGGICFRNYGAPRLVAAMILLSLGPCAIAAALSGQTILLVVALQIPFYLISMTIAAFRLNAMLVATMCAERDNDHRARHDPLTGLVNRTGLEQAYALAHQPVFGAPRQALFYLDLDGFKAVNDTYGHAAGDQLLIAVAGRLRALARPGDIVARIGGDEFVILVRDGDRASVARFGAALVDTVAGSAYPIGADLAGLGVSIGIALAPPEAIDLHGLMHRADRALYDAKAGGGGCVIADAAVGSGLVPPLRAVG